MDEYGQVIDVYISPERDSGAARRFFDRTLATAVVAPIEVVTTRLRATSGVLEQVLPQAWHRTERYANNRIEADHAQLKRRLRPMRGLKTDA
ncbi:MAG TPA: DDE-type integrase/transposase/recombinase, partial [Pseudonocardiaceae bacterium]